MIAIRYVSVELKEDPTCQEEVFGFWRDNN